MEFFLMAIVVGAIIGFVARLLVPGRQNMSVALTVGVGIIGAVVGAIIGSAADLGTGLTLLIQVAIAAALVWFVASRSHASSRNTI